MQAFLVRVMPPAHDGELHGVAVSLSDHTSHRFATSAELIGILSRVVDDDIATDREDRVHRAVDDHRS